MEKEVYKTQEQEQKTKTFESLTTLNNTTQRAQNFLRQYQKASACSLYEVYNTFSQYKARAFDYCKELQAKLCGEFGRVASACVMYFAFAFIFDYEGQKYLCYITKSNNYKIKL